jgi:hypothetical protein
MWLHKKIDLLWTWISHLNSHSTKLSLKFQRGKRHLRREVKLHQPQNRNDSYNGTFDGTSVVRRRDQSIFMVLLMVDRWTSCVFRWSSYQWSELSSSIFVCGIKRNMPADILRDSFRILSKEFFQKRTSDKLLL